MLLVNPGLKQIVSPLNEEGVRDWYQRSLKRMSAQGCTVDKNKSQAFIAREILQINDRAAKLSQAIAINDPVAVQDLLSQGQLYANVRGRCLHQAYHMQNFEMVRMLAESGPIPDKDRMPILKLAIRKRQEEAFDALLPSSMPEKERVELLLLAIECSNFRALSRLLAKAELSREKIDGLIQAAALKNKPKALKILLDSHTISDPLRKRIGDLADRKGYAQISELLLGKSGRSIATSMRSLIRS